MVCYVDSVDGVQLLDEVLAASGGLGERRLGVLVELGHDRGRTGCRTPASAAAVADAVGASRALEVAGVAGYEGGLGHDRLPGTVAAVRDFCLRLGHCRHREPPCAGIELGAEDLRGHRGLGVRSQAYPVVGAEAAHPLDVRGQGLTVHGEQREAEPAIEDPRPVGDEPVGRGAGRPDPAEPLGGLVDACRAEGVDRRPVEAGSGRRLRGRDGGPF